MTDPQPFQGFTARRASQGPSDQPTTPIRRAVPSFALGSTDSTADPSRPTSPLQPIPMRYSPNNPFTQSTSLYRTPTQGPLRPRSAPASPSLGLPPSASAGPTGPAPVGPTVPPPTSAPAASNPQTGPDLASAIALLAQTLQQPASAPTKSTNERHNVREPDPFDGSDPTKLRTFFAQLELVFKARPRTFDTDEKKVTYAVSHLKGITLAWFEPFLLEPASGNPPLFLSDYGVFQEELRANFGPYDVVGTAEHDLENLTMSDSHRVARYVTQFNWLATQVSWGSEALRYQFYKGLPDRLKDRISEIGKPKDLNKLRELAQSIDARYWERKAERNREGRTPSAGNKSGSAPKTSPPSNPPTKPSGSSSSSSPKNSSTSGSPKTPSNPPKPYADKLGKDGKLTSEERQRRFANHLCLFCGGAGHNVDACPKKSAAAKARAAKAAGAPAVPEKPPAGEEPKN